MPKSCLSLATMSDNQSAPFNREVYKECMRNFACSLGQVAYDRCHEFHYSGEEGTEGALLCAGCTCHRSFHRKVPVKVQDYKAIPNFHPKVTAEIRDDKPIPNAEPIAAVPCSVYFPDNDENTEKEGDDNNAEKEEIPLPTWRRRTRTIFTAEQKETMVRFAESYDWKPYKIAGRAVVLQFCSEIGITARNFQVWLGNSRRPPKGKNPHTATASSATASTNTGTGTGV